MARDTKFKKGHIPWSKGKTNVYSKEMLEQMSKVRKGRKYPPYSAEWNNKVSKGLKGRKLSLEHRKNLSLAKNGTHYGDKSYTSWVKNKRNRMKRSNGGRHTFADWET